MALKITTDKGVHLADIEWNDLMLMCAAEREALVRALKEFPPAESFTKRTLARIEEIRDLERKLRKAIFP